MSKSQSPDPASQEPQYHVVVVPDSGDVQVVSFETATDLVTGLQDLEGKSVHAIPFVGERLRITKGPYRYIEIDGEYVALFSIPAAETLEFDDGGYLGDQFPVPYGHPARMGQPHDEEREVVSVQDDDDDDDDDDEDESLLADDESDDPDEGDSFLGTI